MLRIDTRVGVFDKDRFLCGGCVVPYFSRSLHSGHYFTPASKISFQYGTVIRHPAWINEFTPLGQIVEARADSSGVYAAFELAEAWRTLLPEIEAGEFYFCPVFGPKPEDLNPLDQNPNFEWAESFRITRAVIWAVACVKAPSFLPRGEANWLSYLNNKHPDGLELPENHLPYNPVLAALPFDEDEDVVGQVINGRLWVGPRAFTIPPDGQIEVKTNDL